MKINRIGYNYTHSKNFSLSRPTGSGDYLLLHIKTPAMVLLQGAEHYASKNSVIIFNKGTPQLYYACGDSYANDFIHFDIDSEMDLRTLPLDTIIPLPSTTQIRKLFKDIYLEFISNNQKRMESIDLLLRLLFVKIGEQASYHPDNPVLFDYYDKLLELRSLIYRHPEEKWTITRLSQLANLSPSYFQRLYKQTFGVSCISDAITSKIEYAKTSLAASGGTIREISSLCGYDNEEHFMRQFKKFVGMTPSEYRKRIISKSIDISQ
jgi:AraC family transcriptional regulator of arabinose operon